ncbi:MAG TPA: CvpA family protein [Candidatus Saccharimonadales bacterium]|nr:CvpA family protein [Candidatus Saccharimonadales bacterium]
MNWIDGIIVVTLVIYVFEGVNRGFMEQVLELIGFFLTIFLAAWTYRPIGAWLSAHAGVLPEAADPLAFLIDWTVLQALFSLALKYGYHLLPAVIRRSRSNHIAGVFPALAKAAVIIAIVLTVAVIAPVPRQLKQAINGSYLGSKFVAQSGTVEGYLNKIFGRDVEKSLTFLTVPPQNEQIIGSNDRVDLKFTTTDVKVDAAAETQLLDLVNQARRQAGLVPLTMATKLVAVGEAHSRDMFARGYFAHNDPDGKTPFDRMTDAGITFKVAGENLAYAANVQLAFNGLMNSPEHRANILEKDFRQVGMGVIDGGIYGEMFTQDFTN